MSTPVRKWREHRRALRDMREIHNAIDSANTPTMRAELMAAAQRQHLLH